MGTSALGMVPESGFWTDHRYDPSSFSLPSLVRFEMVDNKLATVMFGTPLLVMKLEVPVCEILQ